MIKRILLFAILILITASGCYNSSPVNNFKQAKEPAASIKVIFNSTTEKTQQYNQIKASSKDNTHLCLALDLFLFEDSNWQKTSIKKQVEIINEQAEISFAALPCQTARLSIDFIGCSLNGKKKYHGATDLAAGENIINMAPSDSNHEEDLTVKVFDQIVEENLGTDSLNLNIISLIRKNVSENITSNNPVQNAYDESVQDLTAPVQEPPKPVLPETEPVIDIRFAKDHDYPLLTDEPVKIIASFSDLNNNITLVEFYLDGRLIDQTRPEPDTTSHSFEARITEEGTHELSCRVFDSAFNTTFSNRLELNVKIGFFLPEDLPYELIFSNLQEALSSTKNFQQVNSIASISTPESNLKIADQLLLRANKVSPRKKRTQKFDQNIESLRHEWSLPGKKPESGKLRTNIRTSSFYELVTGETCQFNIRNQNSGYFYQKNFYKLAQNDECIVFAMEESFDSEACIFPETAELIADLFGKHNPLHPQGTPIADLNRFVFGSEWRQNGGRDNENRLLILVYRSDFAEEGSYGYFRPVDQLYPAGGYNDYYSNGGEIIYINENALNSIQEIVSTVSHEFQHCIFLNQAYIKDGDFSGSNNASLFFNEGCAMLASDLNYAESPQMTEFAAECLHDSLSSFSFFGLVDFEGYSMDYGRAWLIVKYIYEKSGQSHLQQMIRTTPEFYNAHLSPSKSNEEFLMDWHCALRLSGRTTSDICYKDMDLFKTVTSTEGNEYLLEGSLRILKKPEELSVFPLCAPGVSCNLAIDGNNHCGKVYIDFKKENSGARALLFDTNGQFLNFKQINN